jgi:hypothetical protein
MQDDSKWDRFKRQPTREVNSALPVSLADRLDQLRYQLKRDGYKITRNQIVTVILSAFFQGDHAWARLVREESAPE